MQQSEALKILKTGVNVFVTGEPGSGKTYTINEYVSYLNSHGIEPAITASTGIAATHINGMTIHSWSGVGIKNHLNKAEIHKIATNDYVVKRVGPAKVLIIDEISMLPPDTLQMVDLICKEVKKNILPFGGIQVVLVGDFFQLPPIVKKNYNQYEEASLFEEKEARFVYDSYAWHQAEFVTCYITEQHRQDDTSLLSILAKIRINDFDDMSLDFIKGRKVSIENIPPNAPKLYTHNIDVDTVNDRMLSKIQKEVMFYPMVTKGHEALIAVMKKGCLSPEVLYLKVGASVMFTKNNQKEGYVNGTLGIIDSFDDDNDLPIVKLRNGKKITVNYAEWSVEEEGKIKGRLSQIPLRLAWAITVHKSQGISLDEAVMDLSKVFEYGQGYVALSRVRRLDGVYLLGWNEMAFQVDREVLGKDQMFRLESESAEKMFNHIPVKELKELSEEFIAKAEGYINVEDVIPKTKKKKVSTYDETLKLWKEGLSIHEIANTRKVSGTTIFGHIEELVRLKKIPSLNLARELSPQLVKDLSKIHLVFKTLNTDRLTPVFEHFKGKYSYDDLKLARMMM